MTHVKSLSQRAIKLLQLQNIRATDDPCWDHNPDWYPKQKDDQSKTNKSDSQDHIKPESSDYRPPKTGEVLYLRSSELKIRLRFKTRSIFPRRRMCC